MVVVVLVVALVTAACGSGGTETVTIVKKRIVRRTHTVTVTAPASSTGASTDVKNLVVTPSIRHLLWLAEVEADGRTSQAKSIKGPLHGVYYGEDDGTEYALAAFTFPETGTHTALLIRLRGVPTFITTGVEVQTPAGGVQQVPCALRMVWNVGCGG